MNIYQPQSGDIYEPVDRAQKFREQQNAFARQQAVRNALAQSIDPRTGRTNWQQAYAMGGADVAPDIQGLQQADMLAQAKLAHERGLGQKAGIDAETAYWTQQRDVASRIGDQASWSSWRSTLPAEFQQFVPEQYSPENQRMTLATADKALELHFQQVDTGAGGYTLSIPKMGGTATKVPGSEFTKTLSPAESERLDIDRKREQRLAAGVDPASFPNVYQAVSEGRIPISRVNSRTAAIFEGVLAKNPDADLTGMNEEQVRNLAGARTGGVTQQNLEMAGTEARNMIAVARNAAKAANLSDLKAVNQFTRWLGGQTGNPKYAALNTAINSLLNSYARAVNPRGVPTVSDKQHAREILDSAMAAGNLEAAFSMMETEIAAAHAAAGVGPGGKKPPAVAPAAAPSGKTVVRTGTVNNRKVVQYSDGSIEYAD